MKNEFGVTLDRCGYAPSIMQRFDTQHCYLCGSNDQKLDRHEPFGGAYRTKSKRYGMWILLCHDRCHFGAAHKYGQLQEVLKKNAQEAAMREYDWTVEEFRERFGKNWT